MQYCRLAGPPRLPTLADAATASALQFARWIGLHLVMRRWPGVVPILHYSGALNELSFITEFAPNDKIPQTNANCA